MLQSLLWIALYEIHIQVEIYVLWRPERRQHSELQRRYTIKFTLSYMTIYITIKWEHISVPILKIT